MARQISGYGDPATKCHIAADLDRIRARLRELRGTEELPVLEEDCIVKAVRLGCEVSSGPSLRQGLDDGVTPDTRAAVVLELEVGVQAGDDGVFYSGISGDIRGVPKDDK